MTDTRKKASMSQVLADIKPYITKKFMAAPCIKEQDIQAICQRARYSGYLSNPPAQIQECAAHAGTDQQQAGF